jgi:hypothetical protein
MRGGNEGKRFRKCLSIRMRNKGDREKVRENDLG